MTRLDLQALLHRQPGFAYEIVRQISNRLEQSENLTILDLQEKNRQLTAAYQELQAAQAQLIEKEKLERELEIARQIQLSILPHQLPSHPCYDFGALMIPARAVGGDFYGFLHLDTHQIGVIVGDVSDKGVPAALFMALTYSLLIAEAPRNATPGDTLRLVNRHLLRINVQDMFVTILYGILDCNTNHFMYARAGHPFPIFLDEKGAALKINSSPGQPLGLFDELLLDEQSLLLPKRGVALLFTDGLTETVDDRDIQFDAEKLGRVISAMHPASAQEICDTLWKAAQEHSKGIPQQDDFTVVAVRGLRE